MSKKPVISRLRRVPDVLRIPDDENGGVASFVANGLYQGECSRCTIKIPGKPGERRPRKFWVETNEGDPVCPHCKQGDKVVWHWARAQTCFMSEHA